MHLVNLVWDKFLKLMLGRASSLLFINLDSGLSIIIKVALPEADIKTTNLTPHQHNIFLFNSLNLKNWFILYLLLTTY